MARLKTTPRTWLEKNKHIMPGERIEDAKLGEPYAVYRIESDKVRKLTDNNLFKECLTFCMWEIPVSFGDRARILIGLRIRDAEWKFAFSGRDPSFIEDAISRWPESEDYKLSYIIDGAGPDFIMIEKGNNVWLYPFRGEENKRILGIAKDASGHYPLLTVPYAVKKLKEQPEMPSDPKIE